MGVAQSIDGIKKQLEKFLEKKSSKAVEHKVIDTTLLLKCQWTGPEEYTDQENILICLNML